MWPAWAAYAIEILPSPDRPSADQGGAFAWNQIAPPGTGSAGNVVLSNAGYEFKPSSVCPIPALRPHL